LEASVSEYKDAKVVSNWIMGEFLRLINEEKMAIEDTKITGQLLAKMLKMIDQDVISSKIAKTVFEEMFYTGKDPEEIVKEKGLKQISDQDELGSLVEKIIDENPSVIEDIKNGKDKAVGYLVGQVMKETKGKANPQMVNKMFKEKIK